MENYKLALDVSSIEQLQMLYGSNRTHLNYLEKQLNIEINERGNELLIKSEQTLIPTLTLIFDALIHYVVEHNDLTIVDLQQIINRFTVKKETSHYKGKLIAKTETGKPIYTKTNNQDAYMDALKKHAVTFGIGPAGTGKTYLAVVDAVQGLKLGNISKIVLTRPAVEAGENLGFLPGDLKEKVDPYLRPLYDALYELLGVEQTSRLIEKNIIEIAPLAYMRGRTLDEAYIILDEAQNTTTAQMKMFLTRLGNHSRMVITGDITQIDLPKKSYSGLLNAKEVLQHIDDIAFIQFDSFDVVRHPIVQKIIEAYEEHEHD